MDQAEARRAPGPGSLTIAMVGTRGVPASYGGFETAIEEVGSRLVSRGHRVVVYCRDTTKSKPDHLGMERVVLPALHQKQLETLSHSALSTVHAVTRGDADVALVFNAANSMFLPLLRARGVPTALHVDGLEWKRAKWGRAGRRYYRWAEQFGVRWADALIADAPGIADYYADEFSVETELIRYGAPIIGDAPPEAIRALDLEPDGFHLVVARFEPENHVLEIVRGYHGSQARKPLVVVGSAPYAAEYTREVERLARIDSRIRTLGGVWDQDLLDALYTHASTYVHGHSVGGTNPSLLRAIGAGTAVIAYDVGFNKEIVRDQGWYFRDPGSAAAAIVAAEEAPETVRQNGLILQHRARVEFTWSSVTTQYEDLARRLATTGPRKRLKSTRRRERR